MAKISPVSIKYMVHANFEAEGAVEKPDVIGALFGQTEGLLGRDLEMRELQKEGKIGRIEVELKPDNGKTIGEIQIPSALDKTETTLIAAAIETIERIGPSNSKITVDKIEDVRENKRDYILERAKKLLEGIEEKMPKTREIAESIKTESRAGRIKEYGPEKLPAGNIEGDEIIVVEGRADVLNLLRNSVENVIGMNGTVLPEGIKELSFGKEVTLFVDGDRGGKLIAKNVIGNAKVDYIAFAPDGKEVEELSGKEILMSLRRKIPVQEFLKYNRIERPERVVREERIEEKQEEEKFEEIKGVSIEENKDKLKKLINEVENTKSAIVLDDKLDIIGRFPTKSLYSALVRMRRPYVIVVDTVTSRIVEAAEKRNVKNIAAKNFAFSDTDKVNLISV